MTATRVLLDRASALGWRMAVVPLSRRAAAIQAIVDRHERGELDEGFYQEYLAPMLAEPLPESPAPRSLILVATPSYSVRLRFALDGVEFPVLTAPGYLRGPQPRPLEVIQETLKPFGLSAARADGPLKTIATMSGFARYCRSNIGCVDGLGTFIALALFVSDLPCEETPPTTQEAVPRCASCGACRGACPTGAIGSDRFLLRAERCITFWNEKTPDVAFPEWIDPEWHNALFGCLICQRLCPENRAHADVFLEGPTFDEATTRKLLAGAKREDFPEPVQSELAAWRLTDLIDYLPRNLGVLAKKERVQREKIGGER